MKNKLLTYFPLLGFIFLALHFSITLLYVVPEPMMYERVQEASKKYTLPFFRQYWNLFSPVPTINKTLVYRVYTANGDTSQWLSPYTDDLQEHNKYRVTSAGRKVVLYSNLLYYLINETCSCKINQNKVFKGDTATSSFNALRYLIQREQPDAKYADIVVHCSQPKIPWLEQSVKKFSIVYPQIKLQP